MFKIVEGLAEHLNEFSAFVLCGQDMANCLCPDSIESPGAAFLTSVRDSFVERLEDIAESPYSGDIFHEIAGEAPDVYTATRWAEFVDLGAYHEEPESCDEWPRDLFEAAGHALYQIAERLCVALERACEEFAEEHDEELTEEELSAE